MTDTTSTRSWPAASGQLVPEMTPPSMYRRPAMVIGGKSPGTAQLEATARSSGAPAASSQTVKDPDSAS